MDRHLHIIALDTPYPVRHGGLFDLFYKLPALYRCGIKIHLHCFENEPGEQPELNKYCEEVHYYPRRKGLKGFSLKRPYIVASRSSDEMVERLIADDFPILLEGVHCTSILSDERFRNRKIILRLHNVEYKYYRQLYSSSHSVLKKLYYLHESILLKKYEPGIAGKVSAILAVARQDEASYRKEFGLRNIIYLPVFPGFEHVEAKKGTGSYCLYHGNLSVAENEKMAMWLIREVFDDVKMPFLIAGKGPSPQLVRMVNCREHISLIANPSAGDMQDIIGDAHIHILPSFNCTGIKLKLLNALYKGRHCVVNHATIKDTGLESLCHIAGDPAGFKSIIRQLYPVPFGDEDIILRKNILGEIFDTEKNINRLIQLIW